MLLLLLSLAVAEPFDVNDPTHEFRGDRSRNPDAAAELPEGLVMGQLRVETLLPAEILVDGHKVAQLWYPGQVSLQVPVGQHLLRVYTQGKPHDLPVVLTAEEGLAVLVGRTGLTADKLALPDADGAVSVEFRAVGAQGATLRLDDERLDVGPGLPLSVELEPGVHRLSVRSEAGTVVWASGMLTVLGTAPVVVHLSEGRLPEVSGGASFSTGS